MERYDVAAERHYSTGECLETNGHVCDAAYHFGLSGENSVKFALRASGVESYWQQSGTSKYQTPMQGHFTDLSGKVDNLRADIAANASGRLALPILSHVLDPSFLNRFSGWSIMIRYAEDTLTPVQQSDSDRWKVDAAEMIFGLVLI